MATVCFLLITPNRGMGFCMCILSYEIESLLLELKSFCLFVHAQEGLNNLYI